LYKIFFSESIKMASSLLSGLPNIELEVNRMGGERERCRWQRGFTLVEMMVVIIIVGILAAVAVPLYTGYVEKAKSTEATSIIGAIITSEKLEMQRVPSIGFYTAADNATFVTRGLDLTDTKYFTYSVAASGGPPANDFVVTASSTSEYGPTPSTITYTYSAGAWAATGAITADMLPQ
jgi:type IV pilus assembly protein PilE